MSCPSASRSAPWWRCLRCCTSSTSCCARVDFLSVGSNDLVQFLYAADRGNTRVADRFDPISAPVLRALKDIVDKGRTHDKPVTLCGELASKPIGALALVALGYRSLSLTPSAVGPVKAMLLELDLRKAEAVVLSLLEKPVGSVVDPRSARGIRRRRRPATVRCCPKPNSTPCSPAMPPWRRSLRSPSAPTPSSSSRANSPSSGRSSRP